MELVLGRCAFAEVAGSDPGTVCQLYLGLGEGLGGLEVERLVAKDPRRAGCRLAARRRAPRPRPCLKTREEETTMTDEPSGAEAAESSGGDPACWAHLVCPECGGVTTEGHRAGCGLAQSLDPAG